MFKKFFWLLLALHFVLPSLGAADVLFYHTDPAGTPVSMTDMNGAVVWQADYKPFGEENVTTGSAANDRRFVGKERMRKLAYPTSVLDTCRRVQEDSFLWMRCGL